MSKLRLKTTGSFPTGYQLPASRLDAAGRKSIEMQINREWSRAKERDVLSQ